MRLIDADELKKCVLRWLPQDPCGKEEKEMPFETDICVSMLMEIDEQPTIQPEIIRCKDCKYWVPGYITDNDDFIPPKCGEWQQMVGHSSDDYCSLAERREVTE